MWNSQILQPRLKLPMASLFATFSSCREFLLRCNVRRTMCYLLVHHEDKIVVRSIFGKGPPHGCNFVSQHIKGTPKYSPGSAVENFHVRPGS